MSFEQLLNERILILDGGLGTMIQQYNLTEQDYRGERFADSPRRQKGNNDLLCITRPDVIRSIHRQYLDAGADIFSTNTFNANAISMADYDMQAQVYEINLAAGRLAREVADLYMREHPGRTVFVAGSMGPTNKTASISQNVDNPAYRDITYPDLYRAYREQAEALTEGGVDILQFETTFDTLNVKAGLEAALQVLRDRKLELPVMLSLTLAGKDGRTFSGQTLAAFLASVQHIPFISIGLNCSFGAADMLPHLRELSAMAPCYLSAYPNAGLPNAFGQYDETPEIMASHIRRFIEEGLVNIVGGCCGTTPAHIARFPALVKGVPPRRPARQTETLRLSGLELLEVKPENNFINIGERCNVAGSRKFLRLIREGRHEEALGIARRQVEDGAQIIDINMDDGLLDAAGEMTVFLNLIASDPDIARVPVMIDSSKWEVIEQALYCVQGKSIVNSISLKEGEEVFLAHARRVRQLGATVVVMAFDETGQADTYERKIAVCERAYRLLTEKAGFPPQDLIFDPNVLAIATGMTEHNGYGLDFIRAVGWIKRRLPGAKVSGGVSNLSFSFRGNSYVREAMHAVFLYHAIREGMDMGIVNPSAAILYEDIEPSFRRLLEDVILARRPEAAEELIARAQEQLPPEAGQPESTPDAWRLLPPDERLKHALIKGIGDYLETDLAEALQARGGRAVEVIDGPLMSGMNRVGELFGAGKMFLPQVVKTARTMKKAVAFLQPAIEAGKSTAGTSGAGKVVFATVKGDVHDIGKNIVSIVLACNNYEVIDLGVMVPAEQILEAVLREKPDLLCLSGLITPSLEEMIHVTDTMRKAGQRVPILIGGATTSKLHTALKIAPHYDHPVIHVTDASQNPLVAARLLNPATRDAYVREINEEYESLRHTASAQENTSARALLPLARARASRPAADWAACLPVAPAHGDVREVPVRTETLLPYINWIYFFVAWRLNGRYDDLPQLHDCAGCREAWLARFRDEERDKAKEAAALYDDARALLNRLSESSDACCRALYGIFPAVSHGDDIRIGTETLSVLRQQMPQEDGCCRSLADFVMPASEGRTDYVGAFAVTVGAATESLRKQLERDGESYHLLLLQTLSDRLAEACAEYLHEQVRRVYWGYAAGENLSPGELFKGKYRGIRPAIGYPSLPDQQQIFTLDALLHLERIGIRLTENGAMFPTASVAGFYFAHPDARYFMVGPITGEQLQDYALRCRKNPEDLRKFLQKNIREPHHETHTA
ncbi:MAG: methionine synthase [Tannerella sp.]|jgi:5-methyltetrahydrofolate--homocysteine methyltransferase|nr:methionine synthase [Tannerella sp.]